MASDIHQAPDEKAPPLPTSVRVLQWLVIVMTFTMIIGVIVLVAVVVTRFPKPMSIPVLPDTVVLPEGVNAQAITFGRDWYAVVTEGDTILIFNRGTGALRQTLQVTPEEPSP